MTFTVISYGGGEILAITFNAIAALINAQTGTLYQPLVRLGLSLGLLWATAAMVYGDRAQFIHNWLVPFYLALSLFFVPTCTVHVKDPVTGFYTAVDHVPWGYRPYFHRSLLASFGPISRLSAAFFWAISPIFPAKNPWKSKKSPTKSPQ